MVGKRRSTASVVKWNVDGIRTGLVELTKVLMVQDVNVKAVLIQETKMGSGTKLQSFSAFR